MNKNRTLVKENLKYVLVLAALAWIAYSLPTVRAGLSGELRYGQESRSMSMLSVADIQIAAAATSISSARQIAENCPKGYICSASTAGQVRDMLRDSRNKPSKYPSWCHDGYACILESQLSTSCPAGYTCTITKPIPPASTTPTVGMCPGYAFNLNLQLGSTGADVVALQTFLLTIGYDIPGISSGSVAKGNYDEQTAAAVSRYQTANGLPSTGAFGPLTRGLMNGSCTSVISTTSTSCPDGFNCTVLRE